MRNLFTILLYLFTIPVLAQAPVTETYYHSWNNNVVQFWENPATVGQEKGQSLLFDFSSNWQWAITDRVETEGQIAYEYRVPFKGDKFALGLGAYFGSTFSQVFYHRQMVLSTSLKMKLTDNDEVSIGFNVLGLSKREMTYEFLGFAGNQFDGQDLDPSISNGEIYTKDEIKSFGPMNVGMWFQGKRYFAGFSFNNVTRPNESWLLDGESKSPAYFNLGGGYHFSPTSSIVISPSVLYRTEGFQTHTADVRLLAGFFENQLSVGSLYQNNRIYFTLGGDVFHHFQMTLDFSPIRVGNDLENGANTYIQAYVRAYLPERIFKRKQKGMGDVE